MQKHELYRITENFAEMNEQTAGELKQLTEQYPWFSLAWVAYLKNLKQINSPEYHEVLGKVAIRVPNRKLLHRYLNAEIQLPPINNETINTVINAEATTADLNVEGPSLIDKFLASNPGLIRRNLNEENGDDTAFTKEILEKSSAESDELITETLANIYFKQKNFEKALHAYQKLSLKYPEKSVYFASRIKEIEDLLNNN